MPRTKKSKLDDSPPEITVTQTRTRRTPKPNRKYMSDEMFNTAESSPNSTRSNSPTAVDRKTKAVEYEVSKLAPKKRLIERAAAPRVELTLDSGGRNTRRNDTDITLKRKLVDVATSSPPNKLKRQSMLETYNDSKKQTTIVRRITRNTKTDSPERSGTPNINKKMVVTPTAELKDFRYVNINDIISKGRVRTRNTASKVPADMETDGSDSDAMANRRTRGGPKNDESVAANTTDDEYGGDSVSATTTTRNRRKTLHTTILSDRPTSDGRATQRGRAIITRVERPSNVSLSAKPLTPAAAAVRIGGAASSKISGVKSSGVAKLSSQSVLVKSAPRLLNTILAAKSSTERRVAAPMHTKIITAADKMANGNITRTRIAPSPIVMVEKSAAVRQAITPPSLLNKNASVTGGHRQFNINNININNNNNNKNNTNTNSLVARVIHNKNSMTKENVVLNSTIVSGRSSASTAAAVAAAASAKRLKKITCFETWYVINLPTFEAPTTKSLVLISLIKIGNDIKDIKLPSLDWSYKITGQKITRPLAPSAAAIAAGFSTDEEYTGEVHMPAHLDIGQRHKYFPTHIEFLRKSKNDRRKYDRAVIFKNKTFYIQVNGNEVKLIGAPQSLQNMREIQILLQIVDDISINNSCVEQIVQ